MSFQPVVPMSGYAGWAFLKRTRDQQQAVFEQTGQVKQDVAYFKEKIGTVKTADDLVADRRLLKVALGAYGLDADIDAKFFVKKVLSDGSLDRTDLANRLSDKRYLQMAQAFGFDLGVPSTAMSDFGDRIAARYAQQQFEVAVGEQDPNLRLALGLSRELTAIAGKETTDDGKWYAVMGSTPVRRVVETALGLPSSFGRLNLDQQLSGFRAAAEKVFGDSEVGQFTDPEKQDKLIRLFLVRSQLQENSAVTAQQNALSMLQSMPRIGR